MINKKFFNGFFVTGTGIEPVFGDRKSPVLKPLDEPAKIVGYEGFEPQTARPIPNFDKADLFYRQAGATHPNVRVRGLEPLITLFPKQVTSPLDRTLMQAESISNKVSGMRFELTLNRV